MGKVGKIFKRTISILFEFLIVATIFSVLQANVFLLGFVPTPSMHPNVPVGSRIFALRNINSLTTGDLIVFEIPELSDDYYIKRLIGLPGDKIEVRAGQLFLNGNLIDLVQEYGVIGVLGGDFKCDGDGYFVLGDNLNNSLDSRYMGRVSQDRLIAKVMFHKVF